MSNQYPKVSQENRAKAKERGEKIYLSGTPCKKCGTYEKYVSTYGCVKCVREEGIKKLNNKELMSPYRTKEKINNKTYKYRTKKFGELSDLTNEEYQRILTIYRECAKISEETGVLHHVDHIHPISKGGKHHPDNLQILTATENIRKGNKLL
jgi:5-methylcytosine-specific restriction endonuclease McrA